MKQIYTTLITLLIAITSFATSDSTANDGSWTTTGTWNLNRIPQDNDSIIIRAGDTITLSGLQSLDNVKIIIYGVLDLSSGGKLRLDAASRVIIQATGVLTGSNNNDQLTIGGVFKFKGAGGSITGISYADNSTGVYPSGFMVGSPAPLPVVFQSFYIARQGSDVQLNWSTSQELDNKYYQIEKSTDGRNWKQVAVIIGSGTTTSVSKYAYTDKSVSDAVVYYRIRQVDVTGNALYSAIRTLRSNITQQITNIYSPSKQTITVDFNSDVKDNVTIQVVNMSGQVIVRRNYKQASYRLTLNVSAGSGIYVVQVSDANGWSEVKKITL